MAVFATARAHLRPGGLLIAAPDDYTDTFDPPRVDYQTNRHAETELTYVEYSFPIATWHGLLAEAGFKVDRVDYPVSKDGRPMYLWVGRVI